MLGADPVTVPSLCFVTPDTPAELETVRGLFREYADALKVDLCFQDFASELALLPGEYAQPRGRLLMALLDGIAVACCAIRPLDNVDYPAR